MDHFNPKCQRAANGINPSAGGPGGAKTQNYAGNRPSPSLNRRWQDPEKINRRQPTISKFATADHFVNAVFLGRCFG
jgi:hypothetical protein